MNWPWSKPAPLFPSGYMPYQPPAPEPEPVPEPKPDLVELERRAVARRVAEQFGADPMVAEKAAEEITHKALAFFRRRPLTRQMSDAEQEPRAG